ncbi:MAG: hypothetical protein ACI4JD_04180 [Ruminococcus sp.]
MKNEDIKRAFESLTPNEESKERMLRAIMEKSAAVLNEASAEPVKVPWYVRYRAQLGMCTAAAVCAAVFGVAVLNPAFVKNSGDKAALVEKVTCTETTAVTEEAKTETSVNTQTEKASHTTKVTVKSTEASEVKETKTLPAVTEIKGTDAPEKPAVTTCAVTGTTQKVTAASTEMTVVTDEEIVTSMSEVQTEVTTSGTTSRPSLYGDLYDFNHVTWAGLNYATSYEEISYSKIVNHLGSGVATGDGVEGTYTILLYEIKGMPVEKGIAVQYAGQTSYYVFYSVE